MLLTSLRTSQLPRRLALATLQSAAHSSSPRCFTTSTTSTMVAAPYRSYIQPEADAEFPAQAGRYHLYVSYSCPFACRALSARNLKGLQDVVSVSVAHPIFQKTKPHDATDNHFGWTFVDPATEPTVTAAANGQAYSSEGATADPVNHVRFVRELYELVDKEPRRYTVPLLWDKKKKTIVSNESADILRTFNLGFRELVPSTADLLPQELQAEIDIINNGVGDAMMTGLYRARIASSEADAEAEMAVVFESVAALEKLLAMNRYVVGSSGVTEADVRLFHTLIRIDVNQCRSSKRSLTEYPNIVNYLRDLYQTPEIKATVHWQHLRWLVSTTTPTRLCLKALSSTTRPRTAAAIYKQHEASRQEYLFM